MSTQIPILDRTPGTRCCDAGTLPTLDPAEAEELALEYSVLSHAVRLQLLDVLARNGGRVCVCDLEAAVPVKQPTVSHHLRLLREAELVTSEKVGIWSYYRVNQDRLTKLRARLAEHLGGLT